MKLYSVPEWADAPELPRAYETEGNPVTQESYNDWIEYHLNTWDTNHVGNEAKDRLMTYSDDREEALKLRYLDLRFLSKEVFIESLRSIADDIEKNFKPDNSLFIIESLNRSDILIHSLLTQRETLQRFGYVRWSRPEQSYIVKQKKGFKGKDVHDAKNLIYVDDWILTAEQIQPIVGGCQKPYDKFHGYFTTLSARGNAMFNASVLKNHAHAKFAFKLIGDQNERSIFGSFPVFGWHKIPDVISDEYCGSSKNHNPSYSIFPINEHEDYPGANTRLIPNIVEALADTVI